MRSEDSKIVTFEQKHIGIAFIWDQIGKMKNYPLFAPLFIHFLAKVKQIASGGLENRNPRPKILVV